MKKLLMLGGSHFQIPAIQRAKDMGIYVITCDYLPKNPGHKYADEYHNISTTDKEAILDLAKELKIDGILAYASDPAAPSASFVAEKLGLKGQPYKSVEILTNKALFREFLHQNGFNAPKGISFSILKEGLENISKLNFPLILKPVDSSGSKGVYKINSKEDLKRYFTSAIKYSRIKKVILEEWISYDGFQIAGDGFSIDGNLVFCGFANEHFNNNSNSPFVPICESFPYIGDQKIQKLVKSEIQKILNLLELQTGSYNFDIRIKDNKVYFLEIGPRNGGNLIPQTIKLAYGVDLVEASIRASLGMDLENFKKQIKDSKLNGYYACYVLHSEQSGIFKGIDIANDCKKDIESLQIFSEINDEISAFSGSNATLGIAIFKSNSIETMHHRIQNINKFIKVKITPMGGGRSLVFYFFYHHINLKSKIFYTPKKECAA